MIVNNHTNDSLVPLASGTISKGPIVTIKSQQQSFRTENCGISIHCFKNEIFRWGGERQVVLQYYKKPSMYCLLKSVS